MRSGRENGDYKARVQIMNVSIKMLDAAWQEWSAAGRRWPCALLAVALRCLLRRHGLTYVEKRQPKHKDNLVEKTEEAIMMEYENQYSNGPQALKSKSRDRSRDSAQREGVDGESARLGHP